MREIRLCDDGKINETFELCKNNNLGIEIQGFYNPYIDNKDELLSIYKEKIKNVKGGKSYHAPFWDLNLGTKIVELQKAMMKIYNEAYKIAKELNCTEMVIHSNYKPGTDWYDGWVNRAKSFLKTLPILIKKSEELDINSKSVLKYIERIIQIKENIEVLDYIY